MPLITKQHQNELTIKHVEFHSDGDLKRVASADSIALKVQHSSYFPMHFFTEFILQIWDKRTGNPFVTIEPKAKIQNICMIKESGLIFFAVEDPKIQSYYIPSLGPV